MPLKSSYKERASVRFSARVIRSEVRRFVSGEAGGAGFQQLYFCIVISPVKTKSSPPTHCVQAFLPSFVSISAFPLAQALKQPGLQRVGHQQKTPSVQSENIDASASFRSTSGVPWVHIPPLPGTPGQEKHEEEK